MFFILHIMAFSSQNPDVIQATGSRQEWLKMLRHKDNTDTPAKWHWRLASIYTGRLMREWERAERAQVTALGQKPIIRYFIWSHGPYHYVNSNLHLDARTAHTPKKQWKHTEHITCMLVTYVLVQVWSFFLSVFLASFNTQIRSATK